MRLIFSFLFLFAVCTLVHSNTIYRKYREIELPVVPSDTLNKEENVIVSELKKDQIPVHIEIVEPLVILKEDKPVESARNVDLEPVAAVTVNEDEKQNNPLPELIPAPEKIVENLKQTEQIEVLEQVRSIESQIELKKEEPIEVVPEAPAVAVPIVLEVAPLVAESVKNVETEEKAVDIAPVVPEIQAPSVRNIEAEVPIVEEAAIEQVIVPVVVPAENSIVLEETVRNLEAANEMVPEVMRKIEQAEEIAEANAEKQSEILNEIIAKETVRNIEPEVINVVEAVVPSVVVEEEKIVAEPKEELRSAVPLEAEKLVEVQEKKVEEELVKEDSQPVKEEVLPKEEIALRSVDLIDLKPKLEEKIEQLLEKDEKLAESKPEEKLELKEELKEALKEELKEEIKEELKEELKPKDEDKKVEEKLLVVNPEESVGSVRQTAESTTPGNVIQQLLQNNPLANFIQSIRPQSAAPQPPATNEKPSAELSDAPAPVAATPAPNLIQQIASGIQGGIQGFQANVQGLFNGGQPQSGTATTRPPFGFITNLFPGQQQQTTQGGTNPPTGGNVPPNPIQGFLGLFNGNRGTTLSPTTSTSTVQPTAAPSVPEPALVDDKIDAVKESAEETETSNENYAESEQELYVGEEGDLPALY